MLEPQGALWLPLLDPLCGAATASFFSVSSPRQELQPTLAVALDTHASCPFGRLENRPGAVGDKPGEGGVCPACPVLTHSMALPPLYSSVSSLVKKGSGISRIPPGIYLFIFKNTYLFGCIGS